MPSKKKPGQPAQPASPAASAPRTADFTRQFSKDWQRLDRSGRYDMGRAREAMALIMGRDRPLGPEWRDHPLKGDRARERELHIGGDFLIIYRMDGDGVIFVRIGSHADLFDE